MSKYFQKYRDTGIDISKSIAYTFHIKFGRGVNIMNTVITVNIKNTVVHGMDMTEIIGHIGSGKRPIARIVMGTFPKGSASIINVIKAWKLSNPDVTLKFDF